MATSDTARRCVCGRSARFPLCDGTHASEAWTCSPNAAPAAEVVVAAGTANQNLAERLASSLGGVAAHLAPRVREAQRLIVLSDGGDLDELSVVVARVHATERRLLWLDGGAFTLPDGGLDWRVTVVPDDDPLRVWVNVKAAAARGGEVIAARPRLPSTFLSHAVADEPQIEESLGYLRRYFDWDVFVCADSIRPGTEWQRQILGALEERDVFVWLLSAVAARSTFCAFEVGYGLALGKPLAFVSLDGTPPPSFAQHLQMVDLPRLRRRKPWLGPRAALVEALRTVLIAG